MRLFSIGILLCIAFNAWAQVPNGFSYQGVARAADGAPIMDQNIGVRVNIRTDSINGNTVFSESHSPTSNSLGLFTIKIGMGTVESGNFNEIDWNGHAHFLNVEIDVTGGTTYLDMGTSQLLSVPYAQYAKTSSYDMGQEARLDSVDEVLVTIEQKLDQHDGRLDEMLDLINLYHPFNCGDPLFDVRDGNSYATVAVGGVCWMAENLKYDVDATGGSQSDGVGPTHVDSVGRYYNWAGALAIDQIYNDSLYTPALPIRGVCPVGWHLPSDAEWVALFDSTGSNAAGELMVGGTSGMEMILAGRRSAGTGYLDVGMVAQFVSSDELSASFRSDPQIPPIGIFIFSRIKTEYMNVRCLIDQ